MLTAVLHGLRAQRRRFVLITTDVKGAFNRTPTDYMDQRYEGLGMPAVMVQARVSFSPVVK